MRLLVNLAPVSYLLLAAFSTYGQLDHYLSVDPLGHHGKVNEILYLKQFNELISVSDDKTIRVFDLSSLTLDRTLRLYSEPGPVGMIYTADLHPTNELLAAGGYSPNNEIYLLDLNMNEVVQTLSYHQNVVMDLAFVDGGNYLVSGSADASVAVWKKQSDGRYGLSNVLATHTERINAVAASPTDEKFVSASSDGTLTLFSIEKGEVASKKLVGHLGQVTSVAYAPNGNFLVSSDDKGVVNLWDSDGNLVKVLSNRGSHVFHVKVSPDNRAVVVSASKNVIVDILTGQIAEIDIEENISGTTYLSDSIAVFAAGRHGALYSYHVNSKAVTELIVGDSFSSGSLFYKDKVVGFRFNSGSDLDFGFDYENFTLTRDKDLIMGGRGSEHRLGSFQLSKLDPLTLNIGVSGVVHNKPNLDGRIISYTAIGEDKVAVGSDLSLKIYNQKGELLKDLPGHNGQVLSVISNADYLISYGSDQTIKFWSHDDYQLVYTLFVSESFEWIVWNQSGFYEASAGGEKYLGYVVNKGFDRLADFVDVSTFRSRLHKDKTGLSEDNYPKSASTVDKQGLDRDFSSDAPLPHPLQYPAITWISPAIYHSESNNRIAHIRARVESASEISSVKILVEGRPVVEERNLKESVTNILIDQEIELWGYENEIQIFVVSGDIKIVSDKRKIICQSCSGTDKDATGGFNIYNYSNPDTKYNLLAIGVSSFINAKYNLSYAEKDADAIYELFSSKAANGFIKLSSRLLVNEEATKSNIISSIRDLSVEANDEDVTIIFIATHGFNVGDKYHVLTHDADADDLAATSLSWQDLSLTVSKLKGKVLVIIDTCHSGNLGSNLMADPSFTKNTEALREAASNDFGLVIMAASTGSEASLESSAWGHGAFTKSILEGIGENKADLRRDGVIFLRELDLYVSERVYELTNGKQNPTTQKPSTISKFPILKY